VRNMIQGALLAAMLGGTAFAGEADSIAFDNELAACVTAATTKITTQANIVSAHMNFQVHQPVGACGCMSALATYTSSVEVEGVRQVTQQGIVAIREGGPKTLVLATAPALIAGRKVQVRLACTPPL
jgi:hypothetical protein